MQSFILNNLCNWNETVVTPEIYRIKTQMDNISPHTKGVDPKIMNLFFQHAYSPDVPVTLNLFNINVLRKKDLFPLISLPLNK